MHILSYCGLLLFCVFTGCTRNTSYSEISADRADLHMVFGELTSAGLSTNQFDGNITWCREQLISEKPKWLNRMIASNKTFYVNPDTNLWHQVVAAWKTRKGDSRFVLAQHFSNEVAVCSPVPRIDTWTGSTTYMAVSFADKGLILTNIPSWAVSQLGDTIRIP
jgi:hypothetical protein